MKRVMVIGSSGAGKFTFAARLGELHGLPVVHLDREFWLSGWVEPLKAEWVARADQLAAEPSWVMDGNYAAAWETRLPACDAIVLLDFGRSTCLARVIRRSLRRSLTAIR